MRSTRTFGKFPLEGKKVFEEVIAPLRRRFCPRYFQSTGNGISTFARAIAVIPAEALQFDAGSFRFFTNICRWCCAVCFPESMSTSDECYCFFVVHRHAS